MRRPAILVNFAAAVAAPQPAPVVNTVPGPICAWFTASLGRSFKMGDSRRIIDLRCDTYNTTNHASSSSVGTVINASHYGLPLATLPMRSVSFQLRYRF